MKVDITLEKFNEDYFLGCNAVIAEQVFVEQWQVVTTTKDKESHNKEILRLISDSFKTILEDYEKSCKHI